MLIIIVHVLCKESENLDVRYKWKQYHKWGLRSSVGSVLGSLSCVMEHDRFNFPWSHRVEENFLRS